MVTCPGGKFIPPLAPPMARLDWPGVDGRAALGRQLMLAPPLVDRRYLPGDELGIRQNALARAFRLGLPIRGLVGRGKLFELLGTRRIAEVCHQARHGRRAKRRAKLVRKRLEMALDEF